MGRLSFGRFVLDSGRGCLLAGGQEVPLRPKTFTVLEFLVGHPGRLIPKDELISAVWPHGAVTDDALVQSVSELRRALGDEGAQIIKTVPRRGYRFDADVTAVSGHTLSEDRTPSAPPRPLRRAVFISAAAAVIVIAVAWAGWTWLHFDGAAAREPPAARIDTHAKPAIAVLPFRNPGGDETREYFADGLTQDLINALGRFSSLTVMSWNAVLPYKNSPANPEHIARVLNARYQVEGTVQEMQNRVRVTAQVVDPEGRVLWSSRFDEAAGNLFDLQDKLTDEITAALAIRVTQFEQQRALAKRPGNLEAYDYVLRARPALRRPTRATIAAARVMLKRAMELDPSYAEAYSALAETYHIAVSMGWAESPATLLDRAEKLANEALDRDVADVRAHIMLGRLHLFHDRYDDAKAELERAIAINPNDADGLAGRGHILLWVGQTDAAIETLELAERIDPDLNVLDRFALALAYYVKGRDDAAIDQAELNLRRTSDTAFNQVLMAAAHAQEGRTEEAARFAAVVRRMDPTFDAATFGSKFLKTSDLERLRDGLRKANLYGPAIAERTTHP